MLEFPAYSSCNDPWYVVQCKVGREIFAANMLRNRANLLVFLPENKVCLRGNEVRTIPWFPGYFFVQVDLRKVALSNINSSPGIIHLVSFDGEPEPIPSYIVDAIYEQMAKLNDEGPRPARFRPNDKVRMKGGALQGLEMIFLGPTTPSQRVRVLLHILGCQREMKLNVDELEKIPQSYCNEMEPTIRDRERKVHLAT